MRKDEKLSLDVGEPYDVPDVLRRAAQEYYEAEVELEASWQERYAGWAWGVIAPILEQAADRIDKALDRGPVRRGRRR